MNDENINLILNELKSMGSQMEQMAISSNKKFIELNKKIDVVTDEQRQVKQATIDSRENIISLKDGQERQDKILESLSLKSLKQETDIRDLKRIK